MPVRGQVVVTQNPGITEFFIGLGDESADLSYIFPHGDTVVLGGTEGHGDWRLEPDPATADRILRDCAAIEPALRGARVIAHRVGLRPVRPAVRLEAGRLPGGQTIVHNYGHGGAGVSLAWGAPMRPDAPPGLPSPPLPPGPAAPRPLEPREHRPQPVKIIRRRDDVGRGMRRVQPAVGQPQQRLGRHAHLVQALGVCAGQGRGSPRRSVRATDSAAVNR